MNLDKLRHQIDQLDRKILRLLNDRLTLAPEIGKRKKQIGGAVFAPDREEALLLRLLQANHGPSTEGDLRAIYREIFSSSRMRQGGLQIGIPEEDLAAYGAIRSIFGAQERYCGVRDLFSGLTALARKKIDLFCFPVSSWLAADHFSKNCAALQRTAQIFLQIQPPILAPSQKRSPLPPYWVLAAQNSKTEKTLFHSGWIFVEGKSALQSRKNLQRFFEEKGWETWIDRVIEYSNRQNWRCGVEWRKSLSPSEYAIWRREFRKLKGFRLDIPVSSERSIG